MSKFNLPTHKKNVLLYPGSKTWPLDVKEENEENFKGTGLALFLDVTMPYDDVNSAIQEFKYHYACYRQSGQPMTSIDSTADKIINDYFTHDYLEIKPNQEVTRVDALFTGLIGLYCYDQGIINKQLHKDYLNRSISDTKKIFLWANDENIKKYHKKTKNKIKEQWGNYGVI